MLVVSERRQETFNVVLAHVTGNQVFTALLHNETLEIIFVQVSILIAARLLQSSLKILTRLEFALKGTVHLDKFLLHVFSHVLRHALSVKDLVIIKSATAGLDTGQAVSAIADAGGRSGEEPFIRLFVVIES